jgi:hypothetical protein
MKKILLKIAAWRKNSMIYIIQRFSMLLLFCFFGFSINSAHLIVKSPMPIQPVTYNYMLPVSSTYSYSNNIVNLPSNIDRCDRLTKTHGFISALKNKVISEKEEISSVQIESLIKILEIIGQEDNLIIKEACLKKAGYLWRLFGDESWEEWAENKSALGRVVSVFRDYAKYSKKSILNRLAPSLLREANQECEQILCNLSTVSTPDFIDAYNNYLYDIAISIDKILSFPVAAAEENNLDKVDFEPTVVPAESFEDYPDFPRPKIFGNFGKYARELSIECDPYFCGIGPLFELMKNTALRVSTTTTYYMPADRIISFSAFVEDSGLVIRTERAAKDRSFPLFQTKWTTYSPDVVTLVSRALNPNDRLFGYGKHFRKVGMCSFGNFEADSCVRAGTNTWIKYSRPERRLNLFVEKERREDRRSLGRREHADFTYYVNDGHCDHVGWRAFLKPLEAAGNHQVSLIFQRILRCYTQFSQPIQKFDAEIPLKAVLQEIAELEPKAHDCIYGLAIKDYDNTPFAIFMLNERRQEKEIGLKDIDRYLASYSSRSFRIVNPLILDNDPKIYPDSVLLDEMRANNDEFFLQPVLIFNWAFGHKLIAVLTKNIEDKVVTVQHLASLVRGCFDYPGFHVYNPVGTSLNLDKAEKELYDYYESFNLGYYFSSERICRWAYNELSNQCATTAAHGTQAIKRSQKTREQICEEHATRASTTD